MRKLLAILAIALVSWAAFATPARAYTVTNAVDFGLNSPGCVNITDFYNRNIGTYYAGSSNMKPVVVQFAYDGYPGANHLIKASSNGDFQLDLAAYLSGQKNLNLVFVSDAVYASLPYLATQEAMNKLYASTWVDIGPNNQLSGTYSSGLTRVFRPEDEGGSYIRVTNWYGTGSCSNPAVRDYYDNNWSTHPWAKK